ncbi:BTB/POZ and TAZ domain-containing protein 4 [Platanthera zijinensis]|uniref:BTB/POZ and TAZ domain-containing protein 4 n=1 Tax=Platanthera zijinensis TaxID=2320716 RepID=A0AAP0B920_9ASPA
MASPVMKKMLKQSKNRGRRNSISIRGVPHDAVRVFLRLLYSSRYEEEEMNQYAMHLLVLFHAFGIPSLKNLCIQKLEKGLLTLENAVDVFQLARLCDAPRLCLLCNRMIVDNFPAVSNTEGWKVMKQSNPFLETELLESVVEADSRKKERMKKMEERKIYLQLHEAMEALVHICRDGCRTIGPHDKQLKQSVAPCSFPACRGLESLIRHFAACKKRVSGGCTHCRRMWQLFELHSRLCGENSNGCKVPLCGHFKEKAAHEQSKKKDAVRWKLLVSKVLEARTLCS